MLNQGSLNHKLSSVVSFVVMMTLMLLVSCLPQATTPSLKSGNNTTTTPDSTIYPDPTFPLSGIFIQEGAVQTSTHFSLPLTFSDSFLVRGSSLSSYLKTVPTATRFCLVSKFTYISGKSKFLILSGKAKSYTDLAHKTTEYYLQVEPSNDVANQNDCLTYNLTSSIFVGSPTPSAYFSLNQLCTDCTSSVTSQGFQLYFNNGEGIPTLNMSSVIMSIAGSTSGSGNVCSDVSNCQGRGYNCCLQGQCVNDGALRPGASSAENYDQAILDVKANPSRYILYPQVYFVCNTSPGQDGQEDTNDPVDPNYDASIRIMELKQLFDCLNKVDGEFAYCTIKFGSASQKIKNAQTFSSAESNYLEDINFKNLNPALGKGDYANNIVKIFYGNQVLYESNKTPILPNGEFKSEGNDDLTTAQKVLITKTLPANAPDDNLYLTFKVDGTCEKVTASMARCTKSYIHDSAAILTSSFKFVTDRSFALPEHVDASSSGKIKVKVANVEIAESPSTWQRALNPNRIVFHANYPLVANQAIDVTYTDRTSPSYHDDTKIYKLPSYANTTAPNPSDPTSGTNIVVKIAGTVIPEDPTHWTRATNPSRIEFSASYPLFQNQSIEITYYVTSGVTGLLAARTAAQDVVNRMCICGTGDKCNLNPIKDASQNVINYECVHPGPATTTPPANQTVYVSNKNVPHRYFDVNGVNYDESYSSALAQEGEAFSYIGNNLLKPSNLDAHKGYTGFNEIYGSFTATNASAAKPAKMVRVKKDTIYDIYSNSGVFSTCPTCGSDYYTSIKKLFPASYTAIGGGYSPDNFDSSPVSTSGVYRSDDLLFGRACFVPATMIPWTHTPAIDVTTQRRQRLAGQHFLFANGYSRDWYGFDYGSIIGSFDGVTWFSVGNKRRIKATSSKLFLAVNAYYGDLNLDSNFNISVSETTAYSGDIPDHDTESDGAECQKSHFCSTDNDCFRQVGYDYTCQNVSTITSNWPQFDANGSEIIASSPLNKSLSSLVGGNNGQAKRCIYRGRGTPCHPNLDSLNSTFNGSSLPGTLACSPNNMCQKISDGTSNRFNDRIARFANTPLSQNSVTAAPTNTDTSGLGARVLGRPFEYYGEKSPPSTSLPSLNSNFVQAVCIPGKNVASSFRTYDLNKMAPDYRPDSSDKIWGIGPTMSNTQSPKYLNACPATDAIGVSIQQYDLTLGDSETINKLTITQNLSTNLINIPDLASKNIFNTQVDGKITSIGYQVNSCLRAPGASCFSDMDCAPSEFIATRVKSTTLSGILNTAEKKYWEEGLICGNPDFKYSAPGVLNTATFNIKNNLCCRDFGKNFTVYTQDNASDHQWCDTTVPGNEVVKVAGVNTPINSFNRYSRVHTGYDKMTCQTGEVSSTKSFALSLKAINAAQRFLQAGTQYKTLDLINQRTCCTKNWVRNFAPSNGGDHKWAPNRLQTINKKNFRALNWGVNNGQDSDNPTPYECNSVNYKQASCEMRDFSAKDVELYSNFFGALELVGIPQAALMTEDFVTKVNNNEDITSPTAGESGLGLPPDGTVLPVATATGTLGLPVQVDYNDADTKKLFSGTNYNALQPQMKKVFSENDFSCCIPSGKGVPVGTTGDQCCTGNVANSGSSTVLRCCLPDYTDLTVYLSRYVSSEGNSLPDSAYDPKTGYIKDPALVENLANQKFLCCSGEYVRGVAIRKLPIPFNNGGWIGDQDAVTKRFTYLDTSVDNNAQFGPIGALFDAGVRWNNHVYCVPKGLNIPAEK